MTFITESYWKDWCRSCRSKIKTRDTIIRLYEKRRKESDTNDCNKRRKEKKGRFAS